MKKDENEKKTGQTTLSEKDVPIPTASYSPDEEWVQQHEKDFSEEPSFF